MDSTLYSGLFRIQAQLPLNQFKVQPGPELKHHTDDV